MFAEYSKTYMQEYCRERNLYAGGTDADLVDRFWARVAQEEGGQANSISSSDDTDSVSSGSIDFSLWTKRQLKEWLLERNLYAGGNRDDVLQRVLNNCGGSGGEEQSEEEGEEIDLGQWTKKELQQWLRDHELHVSGNRPELMQRVADNWVQTPLASGNDSEWEVEEGEEDECSASTDEEDEDYWAAEGGMKQKCVPGRRRALIVGCSYRGTPYELHGTLPDAAKIYNLLRGTFGYRQNEIKVLRDDLSGRQVQPTKTNIKYGLEWLVKDVEPGASLFFYFSGHGGEQADSTGTERSGFNQTICPCDMEDSGDIKDTYLHQTLVKSLPVNACLHVLVDSCHSGTILNLPNNAVTRGGKFVMWEKEYSAERSHKWSSAGGMVYQFSAAAYDELANEYARVSAGQAKYNGAATHAFCSAILKHKANWGGDRNITYGDLLQAMHDELQQERKFRDQTPTLSSAMELDIWSVGFTL